MKESESDELKEKFSAHNRRREKYWWMRKGPVEFSHMAPIKKKKLFIYVPQMLIVRSFHHHNLHLSTGD